jgi:hypothetical protein
MKTFSLPFHYTEEEYIQYEGRFTAFGMEFGIYVFFTVPAVILLLLLAYLIHPSKFERFSKIAKIFFLLLAIGGFGAATAYVATDILTYFHNPHFGIGNILEAIILSSPMLVSRYFLSFCLQKG